MGLPERRPSGSPGTTLENGMGRIESERDDRGVLTLWLDNPGRLNALSNAMVLGLCEAFGSLAHDTDNRVVILRGRGGVFCAGRDLKDLLALQSAAPGEIAAMYDRMEEMNRAIYTCPLPVMAVVEGHALGIATMLVSWTDIAIAADTASLGYPEVRHGIVPYGAVPTMMQTMPHRAVMELLLCGRKIDAAEAVRLGIVSRAVAAADLEQQVEATITELLAGDAIALTRIKQFARHCEGLSYDAGIGAATRMAKSATARSSGAGAKIAAFLERKS
jgi:enoyl-CoA hydratase/carnithine racemase